MAAAEVRAEGVKRWADTGEERVPVLRGCSLAAAGGLTAIVGPSGAGKTSLLYCMSGLDAPDEGRVLVAGRDLYAMGEGARTRFLRQAAAFVFQSYNLVPYLTVEENATLPIALARGKVDRGRLRDLLGRFGLADRAKAPAGGLSGGEQQRAALVRALLSRPAVLFADEPTGPWTRGTPRSSWASCVRWQTPARPWSWSRTTRTPRRRPTAWRSSATGW